MWLEKFHAAVSERLLHCCFRFFAGVPAMLRRNTGGARDSRNRLTGELVDALIATWPRLGPKALKRLAEERPASYLKLMAHIFTKMQKAQLRFPGAD